MTSSTPTPGWYPNPSGEPGQRYWDGHNWTIVSVPATSTVAPYRRPGWYPNPSGDSGRRYWNGSEWTGVDSPVEAPPRSGSKKVLAITLGALFVLVGGCVSVAVLSKDNNPPDTATTTPATPTDTPEEKFVDDMNDKFGEKLNPGKSPISDFFDWRTFTDDIAETGHEICAYLGSHSYDETARQFKLRLPLTYPSDSDSREFVDTAIDNLCPQYTSMKPSS